MSKKLEEVIKKLSNSLRRNFEDFKGMYLFGAYLDGEEHEDEDIELAAIFEIEDKSKRELIWPIVGKVETELDVCIDLYPYTKKSFEADEDIYKEVMARSVFYNSLGIRQDKALED